METITIYEFDELPEDIQLKVIKHTRRERELSCDEIPWRHETFQSLKTLINKTHGAELKDYSLGLDSYSYLKIDLGNANDLTGARALAWLENNLFCDLRTSKATYLKNRKQNFCYGYRVGKIPDCPLTGYCADQDYIEHLVKSVLSGNTLKESYESLANVYTEIMQNEYDAYLSDEYIREELIESGKQYTIEGNEVQQ